MFYSYDPNDGIEFHDTAEEAKSRAEKALDEAEFHAADSDWSWYENEEQISWGEVRGKVSYNDRPLDEEEKQQAEYKDYTFMRNPTLDEITATPALCSKCNDTGLPTDVEQPNNQPPIFCGCKKGREEKKKWDTPAP